MWRPCDSGNIINTMEIRVIATNTDYEEALAEIRRLWNTKPGSARRNKLEVLAMLAHQYEREREPLPELDPIEAIKFRMEQRGLSRKDLAKVLGSRTRVTEVLNRRRGLSINMIRRLHDKLGISVEVLIRPIRTKKAA